MMESGERVLYVLRHAKSSWDDPTLPDHERPLAARGREAVKLLASYMAENQIEPELILCSSAVRTRQTLQGVFPANPWSYPYGEVCIEHGLYGASDGALLKRIRAVPNDVGSVMLIGHHPAVQMLVLRLAGAEAPDRPADAEGIDAIRAKLPTGALVTLTFDRPWSELADGATKLDGYVRPKDLRRR